MKRVEIISIGDELLRGIVQESNAYWISKRITARGASLERVTTLPDRPATVAAELRAAIERAPALVITHGGLGPTEDDRTRDAYALALGAALERDPQAVEMVTRRYAELARDGAVDRTDVTPARARMADLPHGADALGNQVGAAPAFTVRVGSTLIVALPGVPRELYWIWENTLEPVLHDVLGPGGFAEETVVPDCRDESRLASMLARLQERHAGVYVKSRASGFDEGDEIRVTLHAMATGNADARALIEGCLADLRAALRAEGIGLRAPSGRPG